MKLTDNVARQQDCVARTIEWLHQAWEVTDRGSPLQPDPFYERNALITPEVVQQVIDNLEGIFKNELVKFPDYHRRAQGISAGQYLVPPGFDKLPYSEQLAIVQGIDRIFQEYREVEEPEVAPP
jgi:hypothetical protein